MPNGVAAGSSTSIVAVSHTHVHLSNVVRWNGALFRHDGQVRGQPLHPKKTCGRQVSDGQMGNSMRGFTASVAEDRACTLVFNHSHMLRIVQSQHSLKHNLQRITNDTVGLSICQCHWRVVSLDCHFPSD
jgi:hypothetical protein